MTPQLSPAPLVTGVCDHVLGHMAAIASGADGATQIVVVGQLIGEDRKASHLVQHLAAKRDCGAETGMGHTQPKARQNIWQKLIVDPHGRQPRPQGACRRSRIEAGYEANRSVCEGGDHIVQVGASDSDIAIRHHHDLAADRRLHID